MAITKLAYKHGYGAKYSIGGARDSDSRNIPNFKCKMLAKAIRCLQTHTAHIGVRLRTVCGDDDNTPCDNFVNHAELAKTPICAKVPICAKTPMITVKGRLIVFFFGREDEYPMVVFPI